MSRSAVVLSVACCVLASAAAILGACSSSARGAGPNPAGGTTSSSGFQPTTSLPDAGTPTCVAQEGAAVPGKRPVDIIFAIDNSASMKEEIAEVEQQINENFTSVIDKSGADYRVIMLSSHGAHDVGDAGTGDLSQVQRICVRAPLSGTDCSPIPPEPAETTNFVQHDMIVNSNDAWCKILTTFSGPDDKLRHPKGWSEFLRPVAFKLFVVITDDRVRTACNGFTFDDKNDDVVSGTTAAKTFDNALLSMAPLQFGTAARRNYAWHSIIGLAPFDSTDTTLPHPPNAPVVIETCSPGAEAPATGYQALSKLTGGLRYPTCGLDFTPIFRAMALDAIDKTVLSCEYAMPANPSGGTIDPATAVVRYTSKGVVTDLVQVAGAAACGPNNFYIEADGIKLCDNACVTIRNDPAASVKILFGCLPRATQ
jgi:hypothetical protein